MFDEPELIVIKNALAGDLENCCRGDVDFKGAKDLAYLSKSKFEDIDPFRLKWTQSALKKVIKKLVELNGN